MALAPCPDLYQPSSNHTCHPHGKSLWPIALRPLDPGSGVFHWFNRIAAGQILASTPVMSWLSRPVGIATCDETR
jgi:hypothetical protein